MAEEKGKKDVLLTIKTPFMQGQKDWAAITVDADSTVEQGIRAAIEGLRKSDREEDALSLERMLGGTYQVRIGGNPINATTRVGDVAIPKVIDSKQYPVALLELLDVQKGGYRDAARRYGL